jgi:hypothetical protein
MLSKQENGGLCKPQLDCLGHPKLGTCVPLAGDSLTLAIDRDETDTMETARRRVGVPFENLVYFRHC